MSGRFRSSGDYSGPIVPTNPDRNVRRGTSQRTQRDAATSLMDGCPSASKCVLAMAVPLWLSNVLLWLSQWLSQCVLWLSQNVLPMAVPMCSMAVPVSPWLSQCRRALWLSQCRVPYGCPWPDGCPSVGFQRDGPMAVPAPSDFMAVPACRSNMAVPAPPSAFPPWLSPYRAAPYRAPIHGWLSQPPFSCNVPTFGEESAHATECIPMTNSLPAPPATAAGSSATSRRPGQCDALK